MIICVAEKYETTANDEILIYGPSGTVIRPKTINQQKLVYQAKKKDIVFVIGPAGTGKTYISVALAVQALKNKAVKKIIITRPAVEAGENLGYLPGDLQEKIDPYLRPIYDALDDSPAGPVNQNLIIYCRFIFFRNILR